MAKVRGRGVVDIEALNGDEMQALLNTNSPVGQPVNIT